MLEDNQRAPHNPGRSTQQADQRAAITSRFEQFEKRQSELWRLTFVVLFVLAVFFAWTSWGSIRSFAHRYEVAPPVLFVVLIGLFGWYMWNKTHEISELRGLMRGLEQRGPDPRRQPQFFRSCRHALPGPYRQAHHGFLAGGHRRGIRAFAARHAPVHGTPPMVRCRSGAAEGPGSALFLRLRRPCHDA